MGENDSGPRVVATGPATREDLVWNELAAKYRTEELTNLRARAEKWATAMASLIALVSVSTIVTGRDALGKVAPDWRLGLVVAALVSVLSAAAAIYFGARAAQGEPEVFWATGRVLQEKSRIWAANVIRDLKRARVAAIGALLAAALAATGLVFAPAAPPASAGNVLIVQRGGAVSCGKLGAAAGGLTVTPPTEGAAANVIQASSVIAVHPVSACPTP